MLYAVSADQNERAIMSESLNAETAAGTRPSSSPRGLGGPLWLIGIPLAAIALPQAAFVSYVIYQIITRWSSSEEYLQAMMTWELTTGTVWVVLTIVAAELFFRQSSRFPAVWYALMGLACILFTDHRVAHHRMLYGDSSYDFMSLTWLIDELMRVWPQVLFVVLSSVYVLFSKRSRSTFVRDQAPYQGSNASFITAWQRGPFDWDRGFWLLAGYLFFAIGLHAMQMLSLFADANLPMPVDRSTQLSRGEHYDWVRTARFRFATHSIGLILAMTTVWLFLKRAWQFRWMCIGSILMAVASPAIYFEIDPPTHFLDGPDVLSELWVSITIACVLIPMLLFSRRVRERFSS
jgi:hypothetical protein